MMELNSILNKLIQKNGWEDKLIASKIDEHWQEIFGEKISHIIKFKDYHDKILILGIKNPTWKMEIMLRKSQIINKINTIVDNNIVDEIVIH